MSMLDRIIAIEKMVSELCQKEQQEPQSFNPAIKGFIYSCPHCHNGTLQYFFPKEGHQRVVAVRCGCCGGFGEAIDPFQAGEAGWLKETKNGGYGAFAGAGEYEEGIKAFKKERNRRERAEAEEGENIAGTLRDIDAIVKNITIRYENDVDISIQQKGGAKVNVSLTQLGFRVATGTGGRTWGNFLEALKASPDYHWPCPKDGDRKQLQVVNNRLVKWMGENFEIKFPDKYTLYKLVKTKKPRAYKFKFNIEKAENLKKENRTRLAFRELEETLGKLPRIRPEPLHSVEEAILLCEKLKQSLNF